MSRLGAAAGTNLSPSNNPGNRGLLFELGLLCLLALFWGSSYLWINLALDGFGPITVIALRVGIAAIILVAIVQIRAIPWPADFRTWRLLMVQSLLNSFGAWTLLAWGQQFVDSGLAGILNSMSPVFVFFITLLITHHESVSARKLIGALLGVAGVVLIIGPDVLGGLGQQVLAQLAILCGSLLYACAAVFGKRFSGISPTMTAAATMVLASLVMVPASLVIEQPWTLRPEWTPVGAVLMLSVFGTVGALMLYFRLVNTLGSMGVASQGFLRIGVSVTLGIVVLGESLTPMISLGLCAALLGVALINYPTRTKVAEK